MTTSAVLPQIGGMHTLDPTLSADGRYVTFSNYYALEQADPIAAQRATLDVYRLDILTGQVDQISAPHAAGFQSAMTPLMAADGAHIAYLAWQQAGGVSYDSIAFKDMATGASVQLAGSPGDPTRMYDARSLSADGHYLAYTTHLPGDDGATVIVQDTGSGRIVYRLDHAYTTALDLSADGAALLLRDDTSARLIDLAGGASRTVFEPMAFDETPDPAAHGYAFNAISMSADARYVTYATGIKTAGADGDSAVVRKDMLTGEVKVVLEAATTSWTYDHAAQLSPDGRFVIYQDQSAQDAQLSEMGVYVKDMESGVVTRLGAGREATVSNGMAAFVSASTAPGHSMTQVALTAATFAVGAGAMNLSGTAGADALIGKDGDDHLSGQAGVDLLFGGLGNDTLDGGAGLDQASFLGNRAGYTLAHAGADWTVRGSAAGEGSDTLTNVERLHFSDGNVALDIDGVAGQAYRIYQAAFDRTPDAAGLGYWITTMDRGVSLHAVAESFVASAEFTARYGAAPDHRAIVEQIYENILHRPGETAGVDYWTGVLDSKVGDIADVLAGFSESKENQAALVGVMANGVAYTPYFS